MSNVSETNQLDVGGWAPDTLHAWVRSMFDQIERRYEQRFSEQEKALEKALVSANGVEQANFVERDKAIEILATTLRDRIQSGEAYLTAHITQQVGQIEAAIAASRTLKLSLIEGVKTQITSVHREIDIETAATKTAIGKAEAANEKRFESVNEFRAAMADQSALFISRREVEASNHSQAEKIASLTDRINRSEGRGSGKEQLWGYIMGVIAVVLAIMMYFSKTNIPASKVDLNETKIEALRDEVRKLREFTKQATP